MSGGKLKLTQYWKDILLDNKKGKEKIPIQNDEIRKEKKDLREEKKRLVLTKNHVRKLYREWFTQNAKQCEKCGTSRNLTTDHIIPVSVMKDLGIDVEKTFQEENLQILCFGCNQMKSNHLDFSIKKTKELLLRYLNTR